MLLYELYFLNTPLHEQSIVTSRACDRLRLLLAARLDTVAVRTRWPALCQAGHPTSAAIACSSGVLRRWEGVFGSSKRNDIRHRFWFSGCGSCRTRLFFFLIIRPPPRSPLFPPPPLSR